MHNTEANRTIHKNKMIRECLSTVIAFLFLFLLTLAQPWPWFFTCFLGYQSQSALREMLAMNPNGKLVHEGLSQSRPKRKHCWHRLAVIGQIFLLCFTLKAHGEGSLFLNFPLMKENFCCPIFGNPGNQPIHSVRHLLPKREKTTASTLVDCWVTIVWSWKATTNGRQKQQKYLFITFHFINCFLS